MNLFKKKKEVIYIHYVVIVKPENFGIIRSTYEWKQTDFKDLDFIVADDGGNTTHIWSILSFVPT